MAIRSAALGWILISYLAASYVVAFELLLWYIFFATTSGHGGPIFFFAALLFAPIFLPYVLYEAASTANPFFIGQAMFFVVVFGALLYLRKSDNPQPVQSTTPNVEPPNL